MSRYTELCILLGAHLGLEPKAVHHKIITVAHGGPIT